jgi:hypothetical protein
MQIAANDPNPNHDEAITAASPMQSTAAANAARATELLGINPKVDIARAEL